MLKSRSMEMRIKCDKRFAKYLRITRTLSLYLSVSFLTLPLFRLVIRI